MVIKRAVYSFRGFELDTAEGRLCFGGKEVHLTAKEFDLLRTYVAGAGKTLKDTDVFESLWKDTPFVEKQNLNVQLSNLKKKLKSYDPGSEYFEPVATVSGHRFTESVTIDGIERDEFISVSRLPSTGSSLFGRDVELEFLDSAWNGGATSILSFVAWGGVGKTALVNHWLKNRMASEGYRDADRVYAWSFYSQGAFGREASADVFIDHALRNWFGDLDATSMGPWERGEKLANYIRKERILLVLDGVEPLQYPPGPQEGRLRDTAMRAFLLDLASGQPGLCIISSRVHLPDLDDFGVGSVIVKDLDDLLPKAGANLLQSLGVTGSSDNLERAVIEYGGHALALTLLGSYLVEVFSGDIRKRDRIRHLQQEVRYGHHARRILRAYEQWLGDTPELAILRLLAFFDRPAEPDLVSVLLQPSLPGVSDSLQGFTRTVWRQTLAKLRRIKLLNLKPSDVAPNTEMLDTHPLIREYFQEQLIATNAPAWQKGNARLYEHLKDIAPDRPEDLPEMAPLFMAVRHGCEAGLHQEVFDQVYKARIQRGEEYFTLYKLNAFGIDLAALLNFFDADGTVPRQALNQTSIAEIWSLRAYDCRALGRLAEAAECYEEALPLRLKQEDWRNAAINAGNVSRIYLVLGSLHKARELAKKGVLYADKSGNVHERMARRAIHADILHQSGDQQEAENLFHEAEELQHRRSPPREILDSLAGFWYCDLLLAKGQHAEVIDRASRTVRIAVENNWPIDIAVDNLSIGRALLASEREKKRPSFRKAESFLNRAVNGLKSAASADYLPWALISRAQYWRLIKEYDRAQRDLSELSRLATNSEMQLFLVDFNIESSLLLTARGDVEGARIHWSVAKKSANTMGYRRRLIEMEAVVEHLRSLSE